MGHGFRRAPYFFPEIQNPRAGQGVPPFLYFCIKKRRAKGTNLGKSGFLANSKLEIFSEAFLRKENFLLQIPTAFLSLFHFRQLLMEIQTPESIGAVNQYEKKALTIWIKYDIKAT